MKLDPPSTSRWSHAASTWTGTANTAVKATIVAGAAFRMENAPSRMSDAVIGPSSGTLAPGPVCLTWRRAGARAGVGDGGDGRGAATSGAAHSMWVVLQAPPPRRMVSDTIRRVLAPGRSADWRGGGLRREHLRRALRRRLRRLVRAGDRRRRVHRAAGGAGSRARRRRRPGAGPQTGRANV